MTESIIKAVYDAILNIENAIEIRMPHQGFNGYLLRLKSDPEEDGNDSFIIKAPDSDYTFNLVPRKREEKIKILQSWTKVTSAKSQYVCINLFFTNRIINVLENGAVEDLIGITKYLADDIMENILDGYEEYAIVWHTRQIKDDKFLYPHIHFVFKKSRKRKNCP